MLRYCGTAFLSSDLAPLLSVLASCGGVLGVHSWFSG